MQALRLLPVWLLCCCAGGLYGWSALIAPLQADYGVSTAQTGLVFSYAILSFTVAVVAAPHVLARRSQAQRLSVLGLAAAGCLALAATAGGYLLFVLWFSVGFGALSGAIYITSLNAAAQSTRPFFATPLMVAGFGIGGAVFGPVWRLLDAAGWGLGGLWLLAGGLAGSSALALFAGRIPGTVAPERDAQRAGGDRVPLLTFVLIWTTFAFGSFAGLMVLGLAAKMLDAAEASIALSAAVLAGIAIGNTTGRLSVAAINRAFSPFSALAVSIGISAVGLGLTLAGSTPGAVGGALCLIALGYGVMASAVPSVTHAIYGPQAFERVFALLFSSWGLAGFLAPWVAGATFDATGTFETAVIFALGATTACAIAATFLVRNRMP